METKTVIDSATFQELKDLMGADFVIELIETYVQDTGGLLEQLHQALDTGDSTTFGRIAHSIKSSSASLGALGFSQQARELEMLGKSGDITGSSPKVEQLLADFEDVKRCLEELRHES